MQQKHIFQTNRLERLRQHQLYAKLSKCIFQKQEIEFPGFRITQFGFEMQEDRVKSILDWPKPKNVKEMQSFLGYTLYYSKFIKNYSTITTPLHLLTRKSTAFKWTT